MLKSCIESLLPDDFYGGYDLILAPSSSEPERIRGYGAGDRVFFLGEGIDRLRSRLKTLDVVYI